jgi:hypothetical protein
VTETLGYPKNAKIYHQRLGTFDDVTCRVNKDDVLTKFWGLTVILDQIRAGTELADAPCALMRRDCHDCDQPSDLACPGQRIIRSFAGRWRLSRNMIFGMRSRGKSTLFRENFSACCRRWTACHSVMHAGITPPVYRYSVPHFRP